ncbi:MAG: FAD-dependent oxidoreductase [Gemmobacter sp.]|nr:FAD-dependent oxidoreductase [Gemmobacter sp.]
MQDITVMGAGAFGLCIAWEAARRGARVQVIDPWGPGAGASGGVVGALAPHAPESWTPAKALQLQALELAPDWWAGVEAASGLPTGYARTGRVQPLADDRAVSLARARAAGAATLWQDLADWRVRPWQDSDPISPSGMVAEDTLTARLHPRLALAALVGAIRARGGIVAADGPPQGPVIWATGAAGLRDLSAALRRPVGCGEKGQALALRHAAPGAPQIYAPGLHIVPHADGTVAIGSTSERDYEDPATTDAQLDTLHARAVDVWPVLAQAPVVARWAGERPRAASRTLLLGEWPGRPGHFVANGGFKTGFAMAPVAAQMMADLVLETRDRVPEAWRIG